MLIVNGVKYLQWKPTDEERQLHPMVRKHSKEIFGEDSLYFDVKHVLKALSGIGSIPDAYVIDLSRNEWYVVENELSTHPVYDHIVKQLTKFTNGIENQKTRNQIIEMLYDQVNANSQMKETLQKSTGSTDVYHYLSKLLNQTPRIVVIIDEKGPETEEACHALKYEPVIIEFKTFVSESDPNLRAHLFEPLHAEKTKIKTGELPSPGEVTLQPEYALPILESIIELGGSAKVQDVIEKVHVRMKDKLKKKDYDKLPSGAIRWVNQIQWERNTLKNAGYLEKSSKRGIWEITDQGRKFYDTLKQKKGNL